MILGRFLENVLATLLVFVVVYHFEWVNPYLASGITFLLCYLLDGLGKLIGDIFS